MKQHRLIPCSALAQKHKDSELQSRDNVRLQRPVTHKSSSSSSASTPIFSPSNLTENRTQHPGLKGYRRTASTAPEKKKLKGIRKGAGEAPQIKPDPSSVCSQRGKGFENVRLWVVLGLFSSSSSTGKQRLLRSKIMAVMLTRSHVEEKKERRGIAGGGRYL